MGKQVTGMKACTCHDEHRVMWGSAESLYCTPEAKTPLYVNQLEFK